MVVISTMLFSCGYRPVFYPKIPQDGTPLYKMGFKDGCDTGLTMFGNDAVRLMNKAEIKTEMMSNKTYANAWKLGNRYCQMYMSQMQMEGWAVKGLQRNVVNNRMLPHDENLFRERVTDSFWWNTQFSDQPWAGKDSPWFQPEQGNEGYGGMGAGMYGLTSPTFNNFGVKSML